MRNTKKILAILLAVMMLASLCACGLTTGSESGNSDGVSDTKKAVDLCKSDEAYLKEQGYTTFVYSSYLDSYASQIGANVGDLVRVTNAYNDDGDRMLIYYFKTEAQAKACYQKDTSAYKLAGTRVVYGDPQGLIK